ncbi:hypothetical protein SporoP32a_06255 [Sporosarcina ureae]|nr:hypothetical protein SporoP32a_06255 [Sporosarcina ureae]
MRQLAAPPLVGSWLEAIPHVPARVQSMTLTTFNDQAKLEQRPQHKKELSQEAVTSPLFG